VREFPITKFTNFPSERIFGVMRGSEGHLRHMLSEDSMTEEVCAKYNGWILEGMVQLQAYSFVRAGSFSSFLF